VTERWRVAEAGARRQERPPRSTPASRCRVACSHSG